MLLGRMDSQRTQLENRMNTIRALQHNFESMERTCTDDRSEARIAARLLACRDRVHMMQADKGAERYQQAEIELAAAKVRSSTIVAMRLCAGSAAAQCHCCWQAQISMLNKELEARDAKLAAVKKGLSNAAANEHCMTSQYISSRYTSALSTSALSTSALCISALCISALTV